MTSHYSNLPARNFWKTGVAEQSPETVTDLYRKKFDILPKMGIATAGSCFAQHIARHLRAAKANVLDVEPPPSGLSKNLAEAYGYGLFSARFANIYVTRQLRQLVGEAEGHRKPQNLIWTKGDKFVDGLRPTIDPEGFETKEEVIAHRQSHLAAIRRMIRQMNLMIFTLGLTESWIDQADGQVYPTAPGVAAAPPEGADIRFHNMTYPEIMEDFRTFRAFVRKVNPSCRFLLTVSPVPLTATAEDTHVLSATIYSKSVLRAVAGDLARAHPDIDYFPSYELIASHFSHGKFFADNMRSITNEGVGAAMGMFMRAHADTLGGATMPAADNPAKPAAKSAGKSRRKKAADSVCEEELLEAFSK